jgi:hypothetical protein
MNGKAATRTARALPLVCATLTVGLGVMTFVGWTSGLSILASVRAKYIPMAPSTALCFSVLGIGIIIQTVRPSVRWVPRVLSVAALALACAKLMEFLGGINFGIDAWFVRNPGKFGAVPTGRMSPITALNLLFTATALLALASNRFRKLAGTLGALATVIAITGMEPRCCMAEQLFRSRSRPRARFFFAELPSLARLA